ncbi:EI24 domain-containing protein tank isoform X1 [Osmia lignaria lignaria]|uniref:etoposide-induced protein 2.4 homolog n=2 Tax=Osmia lignaria TaxID=473952 RepID=UPI0014793AD2|nr:etoposide-induced protein 2.4 homolog [Osmia lignaria]XP_034193134.1 etoposide-induced protein 2.4 homolog [Osmia lignaria]XP_034193143.1 etoposide-induced protein 2.4 homolog [Osmia lignaria]XP_034193150.1 etoposide-induced protein 2.4 homolog [Osmia lignaria]XP_034193156.1 etoposide-induced protein 2.4 homolog [Osmia lignaria]
MDNVTGIIHAIYRGFVDSLRGAIVLFYMDKRINEKLLKQSPSRIETHGKDMAVAHNPSKCYNQLRESKVLKRTIQCCALNGGVFWASILIFECGILPLLKYLLSIIFGHSPTMGMTVWSWTKPFLSLTFGTVWVLPLFLLSRIVNSLWFQDIADSAYRYRQGRPLLLSSVSKLVADTLFSILVQALFLGQGMLVSRIPLPPVGDILALIHMCLLYALYAFEYKWFNMGWELHRRLSFIESNWPYFVGFGLPLAVLTQMPNSYVISGCVFSILFPLFIVSGNEAEPVTGVCDCPLKLFSPVIAIANTLFNKTIGPANRR